MWLSLPHWSSTVTYMIRSLSIPLNAYFFHCEGCPIYTIRTGSPNWWRFVIDCDDPSPLISSQHACRGSSVVLYTYNECHHEPSPILKYCYTSLACLFLLFAGRRDPLQTVTPLFAVTLKSLFHDFAVQAGSMFSYYSLSEVDTILNISTCRALRLRACWQWTKSIGDNFSVKTRLFRIPRYFELIVLSLHLKSIPLFRTCQKQSTRTNSQATKKEWGPSNNRNSLTLHFVCCWGCWDCRANKPVAIHNQQKY